MAKRRRGGGWEKSPLPLYVPSDERRALDEAAHQADQRCDVVSLSHLRRTALEMELAIVERLRSSGATWADLAPAYGVKSGQAVQQRIARLRR